MHHESSRQSSAAATSSASRSRIWLSQSSHTDTHKRTEAWSTMAVPFFAMPPYKMCVRVCICGATTIMESLSKASWLLFRVFSASTFVCTDKEPNEPRPYAKKASSCCRLTDLAASCLKCVRGPDSTWFQLATAQIYDLRRRRRRLLALSVSRLS